MTKKNEGQNVPQIVTATLREPRTALQAFSIFGECFPLFGGVHFAVVEELIKQTVKAQKIDAAAVCEVLQRAQARMRAQIENTAEFLMVRFVWTTADALPTLQWINREGVEVVLFFLAGSWELRVTGAESDVRKLYALAPDWDFRER